MPLIYVLLFSCVPETARWLVMAGREDDAARALAWMGGATSDTAETTPCLPRRRAATAATTLAQLRGRCHRRVGAR